MTGTTISGNRAGRDGGGIASLGEAGDSSSFTDSTISGNHSGARGGGLYNQEPLDVSGTQITGNRAAGGGGGIYDDGPEAMVTLTHSSPAWQQAGQLRAARLDHRLHRLNPGHKPSATSPRTRAVAALPP